MMENIKIETKKALGEEKLMKVVNALFGSLRLET